MYFLKVIPHLQRIHERIANRRKGFQHKISSQYAKNHDIVFVENLQKLNMVKNHKLARSIMDSSWGFKPIRKYSSGPPVNYFSRGFCEIYQY